jgi:uncharacterized protein (DUF1919 family)
MKSVGSAFAVTKNMTINENVHAPIATGRERESAAMVRCDNLPYSSEVILRGRPYVCTLSHAVGARIRQFHLPVPTNLFIYFGALAAI